MDKNQRTAILKASANAPTPSQRMTIIKQSLHLSTPLKPVSPERQREIDRMKRLLPEGFGPDHPQFNVPSLRQKWLMIQGITFPKARPRTANPTNSKGRR